MSVSAAVTKRIVASGRTLQQSTTYSSDAGLTRSVSVADSATDFQVSFDVAVAQIKAIYINSSQAILMETLANGAGVNATLVANVPYQWTVDDGTYGLVNIFVSDLTDLFFTNTSGSTATIDIEVIFDSTP